MVGAGRQGRSHWAPRPRRDELERQAAGQASRGEARACSESESSSSKAASLGLGVAQKELTFIGVWVTEHEEPAQAFPLAGAFVQRQSPPATNWAEIFQAGPRPNATRGPLACNAVTARPRSPLAVLPS